MTLLTVGDPHRVTGGYLFHLRLAERAPRHGAEVTFVSIPDVPLPLAVATGPSWLRAPATRTADVFVLDSIAASAAAPWLSHIAAPIVGMLHQPLGGMDGHRLARSFRAPFDRRAYRTCRLLMVASEWLARQLAEAGVPRGKLRVVAPGKDLDANTEGDADIRPSDRTRLRNGRLIAALSVANWLPRKGIMELLDAVARLPDQVVTLHLVGDTASGGQYARRVRERTEQPDLRERVVVHGLIPSAAVERMYRAADAFVLPSFEEPYGTVWGEAMAAGLPVVGWHAGNLPFLADHGTDGMLVDVGDVPALGAAIEQLARDPSLRPGWDVPPAAAQRPVRRGTRRPRASSGSSKRCGLASKDQVREAGEIGDDRAGGIRHSRRAGAGVDQDGAHPHLPCRGYLPRLVVHQHRLQLAHAEIGQGETEQIRLEHMGVAGRDYHVDERIEAERGDHARGLGRGVRHDRQPRPGMAQPEQHRDDVVVEPHGGAPVCSLQCGELGQEDVTGRAAGTGRKAYGGQIAFERAVLATHPRRMRCRPRIVRCRSRHPEAIGDRVASGPQHHPVRLDEGAIQIEEDRLRHAGSRTGRSTDAHASADS